MAGEIKKEIKLEIGHVLFMDIVGYSKLLINEQRASRETLNQIVRETEAFRQADAIGNLIKSPTGDGMALIFHSSVEEPVECAIEISRALKARPNLPLRMGVHSGPANAVIDVNDQTGMAGAGINMAERVMDCCDAGHILISKHVAEDLEQYGHWQPHLHDLGECEVKHGVRVGVVNLYSEEFGNPKLPQRFAMQRKHQSRVRLTAAAIGLVALLLIAAAVFFVSQRSTSPLSEKSIAVLPFENLSHDPDNAFFADGVQDQVLTNLAKIADLKVISRTSVMQYKTGAARNLREIGQQLGVAHLLEGTVQRAGGKVRVTAQLIDARSDAHQWAENYDRPLDDVFAIQSEIAKAIADQLQAKLSPNEKREIEQAPTSNVTAFEFYARARNLLNITFTAAREDNLRQAVDLLDRAIAQDPNFFLAYASLVEAHGLLYSQVGDHTPARLELAETALTHLRDIRPDAGETHLARAQYLYYGLRDYAGARMQLAEAAKSLPNEPAIPTLAAFIDRRAGKWEEASRELSQAIDLDPRNIFPMQQIALVYHQLRRYKEMSAALDRALVVHPERVETHLGRAQVELHWKANTQPLHDAIQAAIARDPSAAAVLAEDWANLALCERDPAALEHALAALGEHRFGENVVTFDPLFGQALAKYLRGDFAGFQAGLKAARSKQQDVVQKQPDYSPALCVLAVIDSMLGNNNDALQEGRRAMELIPVTKDAISGPELKAFFAIVCAWAGKKDLAIEQLNAVTQMPSYLSYGLLKLQPFWDPLRGDPRFEQIVASLAPKKN